MSQSQERRPHLVKGCPLSGCTWRQTTSYFVGGPDKVETVDQAFLLIEWEEHMRSAHPNVNRKIFT